MRVRTLSAVLALPLFFLLLYWLPSFCMPAAIAVISAIGVSEILTVSDLKNKNRMIYILCLIFAFCVPFFEYFSGGLSFYFILFLFTLLLFLLSMFDLKNMKFEKICICLFAASVIPYFLSGVERILLLENGIYLTIFPFIIAWCCDTFAYFSGRLFGIHKLCEAISPKKTVEGAVGGLAGTVLCTAVYGVVLQYFFKMNVNYAALCIFAFFGAAAAQIGDLAMSLIKRNYSVKDYGDLMPGHGGVLDRFDSVIFVVPFVEIFLYFLPNVITK